MAELKFKVVEIFRSISGESMHSGKIAVFIRLYGCNLRCKYSESGCDTPYGYEGNGYNEMTAQEILEDVNKISPNGLIILTGGEPLIHPDIAVLIRTLGAAGHTIEIETNGTVDVRCIVDKVYETSTESNLIMDASHLQFTVDYKCPSSGMQDKMLPIPQFVEMYKTLCQSYECGGHKIAIKFVVKDEADLNVASEVADSLLKSVCGSNYQDVLLVYPDRADNIFISPVFGTDIPAIVEYMENDDVLCWCKLQLQMHKYIWDPEQRGV